MIPFVQDSEGYEDYKKGIHIRFTSKCKAIDTIDSFTSSLDYEKPISVQSRNGVKFSEAEPDDYNGYDEVMLVDEDYHQQFRTISQFPDYQDYLFDVTYYRSWENSIEGFERITYISKYEYTLRFLLWLIAWHESIHVLIDSVKMDMLQILRWNGSAENLGFQTNINISYTKSFSLEGVAISYEEGICDYEIDSVYAATIKIEFIN